MNYMLYCTAFLSMLATTSAMARTMTTNDSEILSHSNQDGPQRSLLPGGPALDASKLVVKWDPPLQPTAGSDLVADWATLTGSALTFLPEFLPPDTSTFTAEDSPVLTVSTLGPLNAHAAPATGVAPMGHLSVPSPGVLPLALCALLATGRRRRL